MTITEFLEARLAEDEAAARSEEIEDQPHRNRCGLTWIADWRNPECTCDGAAHALAQVAAHRAIVEDHQPVGVPCRVCVGGFDGHDRWPCPTVRALAAVYADHPDYEQGWRP